VFLNNDTVVTEGWLEGLMACLRRGGPEAGLVGPVTNYSRPPQQVAVDYSAPNGVEAFAARQKQQCFQQGQPVTCLSGFCLLVRRDVLDRIGSFDERYGLGFFDDDDLCIRAREAGFQLWLAADVFVHHFGSRTFTSLGVDCRQQLLANFDQFKSKWGPERCAGYHLPEPVSAPRAAARQTSGVSLCMIVKNEEANLPECLRSAADLVDEVVVVDTGSSDRTKESAAAGGARVIEFPWVDSFAAARNESLRHATKPWVFWLDADDRLDADNRRKLRALFERLQDENAAYSMKCLCLPDPIHRSATAVDHVRLFRNHPEVRWRYRVHEQILPAIRRLGDEVRFTDVIIQHVGYQDPAIRSRKLERDFRLLRLEDNEHPDDPFTLFNLGALHQELGQSQQALPLLWRSLQRSHPSDSIVRKLYALLVQCHRQLGQPGAALVACRAGRTYYPDDAELLFQEGLLLRGLGERTAAAACFHYLLGRREAEHFASVDTGLEGYKARNNLASLYQEEGRAAEAEELWRQVLAEQPQFGPAWLGLGELFLAQGRWPEFEEAVNRLEAAGDNPAEAAVMRARGHLARKEFAVARSVLDDVITREPRQVWARVILSHALLQEGRDWDAAEKALRDVLALDPGNAGARQNLAVLLRAYPEKGSSGKGVRPPGIGISPSFSRNEGV
jgi:GT2 family glycosyltransferase/tetratricopeptide (TPR) repeat protein